MPQIGQIDVPLGLWEKLIEASATLFADLILISAEQKLDVILTEIRGLLNSEFPTQFEYLENCVIALIRIKRDDYIASDNDIKHGDDYRNIWNAAADLAESICYKSLPADSYLKAIAAQHLPHFIADRRMPPSI